LLTVVAIQNNLYYSLIENWVDLWRKKRMYRAFFFLLKEKTQRKIRQAKQMEYCDEFKKRGLLRMGYKAFKLYSQFAGTRLYEKRVKEKVTLEVESMVEEKKNQLLFLEQMIREMEEKYRIELRKKAILKSQCDQAYLRGVSAISMEALKMSHSTLADYYRGMKMPKYDG